MILHGNARGGGQKLAIHLLRTDENDHVAVHEVSGFMAEDVQGAFVEVEALSKGTRCSKPFFSMSLSPPNNADVSAEDFERAIEKSENVLGLSGQPRVIVFHEKGDHRDRHCHVVWSRIDGETMRAIPMPFNRLKMRDVSRELFIEHGHDVPRGLIDREQSNPLNFTLEEYQQAKRVGRDARSIKADIQNSWAGSDSRASLEHALQDKGFRLARGNRRGFVVTDSDGEVYSLPKMLNVKTKAVRERLGSEKELQDIDDVKAAYANDMALKMEGYQQELKTCHQKQAEEREKARQHLVEKQRAERDSALEAINLRQIEEVKARQAKFRSGLSGLWDWMRGENKRIKRENEVDAARALERDKQEREALIQKQRDQRRSLVQHQVQKREKLAAQYQEVSQERAEFERRAEPTRDEQREAFKQRRREAVAPRPARQQGPSRDG